MSFERNAAAVERAAETDELVGKAQQLIAALLETTKRLEELRGGPHAEKPQWRPSRLLGLKSRSIVSVQGAVMARDNRELRAAVEQAVLLEAERASEHGNYRSGTVVAAFMGKGVSRATLFRWVRAYHMTGAPIAHAVDRVMQWFRDELGVRLTPEAMAQLESPGNPAFGPGPDQRLPGRDGGGGPAKRRKVLQAVRSQRAGH